MTRGAGKGKGKFKGKEGQGSDPGTWVTDLSGHMGDTEGSDAVRCPDAMEGIGRGERAVEVRGGAPEREVDDDRALPSVRRQPEDGLQDPG